MPLAATQEAKPSLVRLTHRAANLQHRVAKKLEAKERYASKVQSAKIARRAALEEVLRKMEEEQAEVIQKATQDTLLSSCSETDVAAQPCASLLRLQGEGNKPTNR